MFHLVVREQPRWAVGGVAGPRVGLMDEPLVGEAEPDLGVLERIEGELFAVERALEQIDEGVYEGFAGLPEPS